MSESIRYVTLDQLCDITNDRETIRLFSSGGFVRLGGLMYKRTSRHEMSAECKPNILKEAESVIYGDREQTYGAPDKNLQAVAQLWSSYLYHSYKDRVTVDMVCDLMILMKVARLINTPDHRDSMVDICGYAALKERVQEYRKGQAAKSSQSSQPSQPKGDSNEVDPYTQTR